MAGKYHIGSIRIDLAAQMASFHKGMSEAAGHVTRLGAIVGKTAPTIIRNTAALATAPLRAAASFKTMLAATAGFLVLRQVGRTIGDTVDRLDELGERARQLGVAVQDYSTLEYAAKRSNIEQDELNQALKMGAKNIGEFLNTGRGGAAEAFKSLGVSVKTSRGELKGMTELLEDLGKAMDDSGLTQPQKLKALTEIFGKGGFTAERLVSNGQLREFRLELERLGGVVTPDQVRAAQAMSDGLDRLGRAWQGVKNNLVEAIGPDAETMLNSLAEKIAKLPDVVKAANAAALRSMAGGENSVESARLLSNFKEKAVAMGMTAVVEIAKFASMTLFRLGRTLAGTVGRELGDAVGESILDKMSTWLGFGIPKSLGGQIAELQNQLGRLGNVEKYVQMGKQYDALVDQLNSGNRLNAVDGRLFGNLKRELEDFDDLKRREADIRKTLLDLQSLQRVHDSGKTESQARSVSAFLEDTIAAWNRLGSNLEGPRQELVESTEALLAWHAASGGPEADKAIEAWKKITEPTKPPEEIFNRYSDAMEDAVKGFGAEASRVFADLVVDGTASFKDLAKGWAKTLIAMANQYLLLQPIFNWLGREFGGAIAGSSIPNNTLDVLPEANGDAFLNGDVMKFAAGGIVSRPTLFPMARGGIGLMGEAGPEAIMPLERRGGVLGVRASGGQVTVNIIDQRKSGATPEVHEQQGPDGRRTINVLIRDQVRAMFGDGTMDRTMNSVFGLSRRGLAR